MNADQADPSVRERLLRAGAEIFAARGFQAATVRDICALAKANVSAVNYHFGSKEGLYAKVLTHFYQEIHERYPLDQGLPPNPSPEERLLAFIRAMLQRMAWGDDPVHAAHFKLIALEVLDPTPALDAVVDMHMVPYIDALSDIIREFLGQDAPPDLVRDCLGGVMGQCELYVENRSIISRLYPDITYDRPGLERMAKTILRFSLHGIFGLRLFADFQNPECQGPGYL